MNLGTKLEIYVKVTAVLSAIAAEKACRVELPQGEDGELLLAPSPAYRSAQEQRIEAEMGLIRHLRTIGGLDEA